MIQDLDLGLISLVSLLSSELYDITKIHIIEPMIKGFFFPNVWNKTSGIFFQNINKSAKPWTQCLELNETKYLKKIHGIK
jgi:hypothetical protein